MREDFRISGPPFHPPLKLRAAAGVASEPAARHSASATTAAETAFAERRATSATLRFPLMPFFGRKVSPLMGASVKTRDKARRWFRVAGWAARR